MHDLQPDMCHQEYKWASLDFKLHVLAGLLAGGTFGSTGYLVGTVSDAGGNMNPLIFHPASHQHVYIGRCAICDIRVKHYEV